MSGRQLHTGFPGTNTLHSEQCRAEIQRFESVHPCIYQIYDMLECLPLPPEYAHMRDEIRDQVVCIEAHVIQFIQPDCFIRFCFCLAVYGSLRLIETVF
nr:C. briggsae CBR-CNT-2 protein [Haemonchus contortus]